MIIFNFGWRREVVRLLSFSPTMIGSFISIFNHFFYFLLKIQNIPISIFVLSKYSDLVPTKTRQRIIFVGTKGVFDRQKKQTHNRKKKRASRKISSPEIIT